MKIASLAKKIGATRAVIIIASVAVLGLLVAFLIQGGAKAGKLPSATGASSAAARAAAGAADNRQGAPTVIEASLSSSAVSIEATGNLEPVRVVDLSFGVSGTLIGIAVKEGQLVPAGAILANLDDRDARYKLADADLRLAQAKIDGNASQTALIALERELKQADLDRTKLRAPYAGVVSSISVELGAIVGANAVAVRLLDRSSLKAILEIDEIDLPLVRTGQKVLFTFDALPGKKYQGEVALVPQEGKVTNQGLAVFEVEALIHSPPVELRPGYSFVASIQAGDAKPTITIPTTALGDRNGSTFVMVAKSDGSGTERRKVTAVKREDGTSEITLGIVAGEKVVNPFPAAASQRQGGGFGLGIPGLGGGQGLGVPPRSDFGGAPRGDFGGPPPNTGGAGGSTRQGGGTGARPGGG